MQSTPTDTAADSTFAYWRESTRPLTGLVFVTPLLVAYETGMVWLGSEAMRNGADVWLRRMLDAVGFGQYFLLPGLLCGALLGWHHIRRDPWRIAWPVLGGMLLESFALAVLLLITAQLIVGWTLAHPGTLTMLGSSPAPLSRLIGYCGAGIYEELLFRLLLLSASMWVFQRACTNRLHASAAAIALTSTLFAAAHYEFELQLAGYSLLRNHGDLFAWGTFAFRWTAGAFFSVLFVQRGFGIAAGAHALYDMLTCLA